MPASTRPVNSPQQRMPLKSAGQITDITPMSERASSADPVGSTRCQATVAIQLWTHNDLSAR